MPTRQTAVEEQGSWPFLDSAAVGTGSTRDRADSLPKGHRRHNGAASGAGLDDNLNFALKLNPNEKGAAFAAP